jgi:predicted lysophospholipase L1 biosynthesis ABC-type transport system permease subunit
MPANSSPRQVEIFKPLGIGATPPQDLLRRDNHIFQTVARLRPGVSLERAQAELTLMGTRIAREHEDRAQTNLKVHPLREFLIGPDLSRMLWILLGAVFVVLLIACMNVANLLVARGAARQREVAIRNALGAGWSRLASQFLVESLVLALAGGLLGIGLGYAGSQALVRFAPEGVPRLDAVGIDFTVLAFAVGLCLLTAIVFGLLPVWNARRGTLSDFIREGGRGRRKESGLEACAACSSFPSWPSRLCCFRRQVC